MMPSEGTPLTLVLVAILIAAAAVLGFLHWLVSLIPRNYFISWPLVKAQMQLKGLSAGALLKLLDTPEDPVDWNVFRRRLKEPVHNLTTGFIIRLTNALDTTLWKICPDLALATVAVLLRQLPISRAMSIATPLRFAGICAFLVAISLSWAIGGTWNVMQWDPSAFGWVGAGSVMIFAAAFGLVAGQCSTVLGAIVVAMNSVGAVVVGALTYMKKLPAWDERGMIYCGGFLLASLVTFGWLRLQAKYPMPPGSYRLSIPPPAKLKAADLGVEIAIVALSASVVIGVAVTLLDAALR